jgi:hypothetical protein
MRATRAALLAAVALSGAGLAVGSAQAAVPTQDSVRATGSAPLPGMGGAFNLDFAVQSDPTGGNITGHAFFKIGSPTGPPIEGPIICFHVAGDTAYVSIDTAAFGPVVAKLVDRGEPGSGLDRFDAITSNATPVNCGFQSFFGEHPWSAGTSWSWTRRRCRRPTTSASTADTPRSASRTRASASPSCSAGPSHKEDDDGSCGDAARALCRAERW